jgi:DNA-binding response OmpR family regulator
MIPTKTVLLVDDDDDILTAMQTALEQAGYRVLMASDGNMALALAERETPDLVVIDMIMPKQSGILVLEKLKARPGGGPPVIMVTANEGARHRTHAESLGVDDYIYKPFGMSRLIDSVRRLCPMTEQTGQD